MDGVTRTKIIMQQEVLKSWRHGQVSDNRQQE